MAVLNNQRVHCVIFQDIPSNHKSLGIFLECSVTVVMLLYVIVIFLNMPHTPIQNYIE